jgi:hypothetical protein
VTQQAENAGSIPVARSRLGFVATTDKVVANVAVGFRHCSPLFARHFSLSQHCRSATTAVNHVLIALSSAECHTEER